MLFAYDAATLRALRDNGIQYIIIYRHITNG